MDVSETSDLRPRANRISLCGGLILLLSAGAAALPLLKPHGSGLVIAAMMIGAGCLELVAGMQRHETRKLSMLAGAITIGAGLLFLIDRNAQFLPMLWIICGWLIARGAVLLIASRCEHGQVKVWTGLSAATDGALGLLLAAGLSIATLVVGLFGATSELIASFAWVLALSFVVTGGLLLEVASAMRANEDA